ncbi:N-carbamoyl-D-amino acid hydrolase [Neolentinus lepideus HHB14362 ss-1]|uniref:N-carbamoyl-D-amino acid hydrolase n=1 Tax=Neolentinus lepideus HHB14362 ss-1 TaxID=1314782 RepID=A0A165VG77_9AGAM|nr:N-carbamoyl-D-amino acid hydrolase [Neolentinus lepideus HHB14362 ss-1]
MPRMIRLAAAQLGAIHITDSRSHVVGRMITLLESAASQAVQVVLFPELAFTTFFPRYIIHNEQQLKAWYEHGDVTINADTRPLFDKAKELKIDISVGYAEATEDGQHFNTCIYFSGREGRVLSKYRKVHIPGTFEPDDDPDAVNHLEKRYFKPGDLGFQAFRVPGLEAQGPPVERGEPIFGMMICNDRRWAESWRVLGLQGVEIVLCGFNTPAFAPHTRSSLDKDPEQSERMALFHHKLVMQAHSYTNATYSVAAARSGYDDGKYKLIAGSCIIDPEGVLLAESKTLGDELVVADCDLELCRQGKGKTFAFDRHRRTEHYGRIVAQTGVVEPPRIGPSGA